jgi:uncharacterized protein (DUF433 family)
MRKVNKPLPIKIKLKIGGKGKPAFRLGTEISLTDATLRIMAENTGQGDSVEELENVWGDLSVFQIYETLVEESDRSSIQ